MSVASYQLSADLAVVLAGGALLDAAPAEDGEHREIAACQHHLCPSHVAEWHTVRAKADGVGGGGAVARGAGEVVVRRVPAVVAALRVPAVRVVAAASGGATAVVSGYTLAMHC